MKGNIHKKLTEEDKFARRWYRDHARLNQLRADKKQQRRKFRRSKYGFTEQEVRHD